jgi:FkbM family methyltransferase
VVAFEPQPDAYQCAQHNCRAFKHVKLVNVAVGDAVNKLGMRLNPTNCGASHVDPATAGGGIACDTLDHYFGNEWVDFIKIDVEGYESFVLAGAERLLRMWRPVLCIEIGVGQQQRFGKTVEGLLEQVRGYGYRLLDSDSTELTPAKIARAQWDLLAVPLH